MAESSETLALQPGALARECGAMRVLLIEDEADLRAGLAKALRGRGYAVDSAEDGEEGLFKALGADYDVVVLDVMLPRLDGWSLLARLRAARDTPVLILTARDTTGDRVRGLDAGADDYLVKPFELAELLARVRALGRRGRGRARAELEAGGVRLDPAARLVTRAGEPVALTAREYSLLHYLLLRRGEVLSRASLHEAVFDETDDSLSNVIDVHVAALRRKLGPELIETRRGHGYVIP